MLNIKKIFGVLMLALSFFYQGCSPAVIEIWDTGGVIFTIKNESSYTLANIKWQNNVVTGSLGPGAVGNIKVVTDASGAVFFTKNGNPAINLCTQTAVTVSNGRNTEFTIANNTQVIEVDNPANTGTLENIVPILTTLTIRNMSFSDIQEVTWQSVSFAADTVEDITIGTTVTKTVDPGYGYIYFKRRTNPVAARTKEVITIEKNDTKEFAFGDDTLIVETNNPDNTGTLRDMPATVVFFDDAEGEVQGYAERKSSLYYSGFDELPNKPLTDSDAYFQPVYKGSKSIALGGEIDAVLRLRVTLTRRARLTFWYAHKAFSDEGGSFFIDETQEAVFTGNVSWSKQEYMLEAGSHDLKWNKNGHHSSEDINAGSYLSLDDILIVYIE
jgi:hypothetical protein